MQTCVRCIYDEHIPDISFDEEGVCNYCRQYEQMIDEYPVGEKGQKKLDALLVKVKKSGKGKKYDVIVGISGGCDSSYMLCKTVEMGLRPLAVHFDNTWNSTIAVENIHNLLNTLNVDLYTHVVNNEEFNDIFKSFFNASVPDIDTPSDIGLATTHYMAAEKYNIKYIFEGHSFRTEGISPPGWFYIDGKYISTIHKKYGKRKMKTFPNLTLYRFLKWTIVNRVKKIRPLYYMNYEKEKVKKYLSEKVGWKWYGGHHMENRTAYFTNNYYLPKKFNIDLRYSEFSALVRSKQITREEALEKIKEKKYYDKEIVEEVIKRLNFTEEEFNNIMLAPKKNFHDYKTYKRTFERLRGLFYFMYKMDLVPKSFYMKYTKKYNKNKIRGYND